MTYFFQSFMLRCSRLRRWGLAVRVPLLSSRLTGIKRRPVQGQIYLAKTCAYLVGQNVCLETVKTAAEIALSEIAPISDTRGSAQYKRLLLQQLLYAHFVKLFPESFKGEVFNAD